MMHVYIALRYNLKRLKQQSERKLLDIAQDHVITWYIGLHKRVHALEWIWPPRNSSGNAYGDSQMKFMTLRGERERVDVRRNQLVWLTVY